MRFTVLLRAFASRTHQYTHTNRLSSSTLLICFSSSFSKLNFVLWLLWVGRTLRVYLYAHRKQFTKNFMECISRAHTMLLLTCSVLFTSEFACNKKSSFALINLSTDSESPHRVCFNAVRSIQFSFYVFFSSHSTIDVVVITALQRDYPVDR